MSYNFPIYKKNSEGSFGPTENEHKYQPASYHNRTSKYSENKSQWVLKQNQQYETFKIADEKEWLCEENNALFSILNNGEVILGIFEQRLAFFPKPVNEIDSWHGYPIKSSEYDVSEKLLDKWQSDSIIDLRIRRKIAKGQL